MVYVSGPREYCQWETFSAECPDGEMLLMKNGVYGRMRLGRCVKNDFGYIGCGSDVLDQVYNFYISLYNSSVYSLTLNLYSKTFHNWQK